MRPQGVVGALVAIAVGAILTYAVSFTVSGISVHTVGVIIMVVGAIALAILLVRTVSGSRRQRPPQPMPARSDLGPDGSYLQDPLSGAAPVAATRVPTWVHPAPDQQAAQPPRDTEVYRTPGPPQR